MRALSLGAQLGICRAVLQAGDGSLASGCDVVLVDQE